MKCHVSTKNPVGPVTVLGEFGGRRETPAGRCPSAKAGGECRRNYMAHNPEVPGSIPGRANMPRGSSMAEHRTFLQCFVATGLAK